MGDYHSPLLNRILAAYHDHLPQIFPGGFMEAGLNLCRFYVDHWG